ncbi:Holliday junction resolvase RuvX [Campylobacter upsaliensis]|uniref:Holliday junction resolvase RuvX n=1 Tax=Campylobacter upsaliensis TaxID=28080 RepID=UPI0002E941E5|nr:Holliday junction resolvase RuvX [Campylobacter upsaliensis]MCR2107258.1 Holliday junction resolvase RuvX [Campylobacter upsaliensis]MCR2109072.1 Holliday junction resolvase RuvX [Campylobacter upsaliensis]MCR2112817.1 Holliday junction resolvase RuvX [Campylobacter upsaliensis]MCR2114443.1 Holliday junction resolvase RuvX [Campylobacter upsaliensis]MCR2119695.1 Holliday junction resolvase RuvX [Campylobacter upsaliensis]
MRALALDLGLKRIGLALYVENIAVPLNAILRKNRNQAASEVQKLIKEHQISKLIVGLPKGGASEVEMTKRVQHFISLLEFDGEVIFVDEAYTSKEAQDLGVANSRKKDGKLDSLAALIMLRGYFGD